MAELSPSDQAGEFKLGFAGDTFNTAWYLAKVTPELDVSYFTAVGTDALSNDMRVFMRSSGIDDSHVRQIEGQTIGLYMIQLNNGERSFCYWRGQSAAKQLALDPTALDQAISDADLIYFSGITLAILDIPSREALFTALRKGHSNGKKIAFDTNLRPMLWASTDEMKKTIMHAAALSNIVLPSHEDEAEWFGDENSHATLERYAQLGAESVVVKNSDQSVLFQDGQHRGEIIVEPATDVVDTTAAGDSFNAGVLAGILVQNDLAAGITDGCILAGHVVRHRGALVEGAKTQ